MGQQGSKQQLGTGSIASTSGVRNLSKVGDWEPPGAMHPQGKLHLIEAERNLQVHHTLGVQRTTRAPVQTSS
jgi:hypothetical protein